MRTFALTVIAVVAAAALCVAATTQRDGEKDSGVSGMKDPRLATAILRTGSGCGSAVVISSDGLALTSYEVVAELVQDAAVRGEIPVAEVILPQASSETSLLCPRSFQAFVTHADPIRNLALVRIDLPDDAAPIPHLRLASQTVRVGSRCLTVGSPSNGLAWTMRFGTIGATGPGPDSLTASVTGNGRSRWPRTRWKVSLIISDCPALTGDSGGPLLDEQGDLIGITFIPYGQQVSLLGHHIGLQDLQTFLQGASRRPEAIPFDPWTAGYRERAPVSARRLDLDGNGTTDATALEYVAEDYRKQAQAIYFDFSEQPAEVEGVPARPRGIWKQDVSGYRYGLFVIARQDHTRIVGFTDTNGDVKEMRIDHDGDHVSDVTWRKMDDHWELRKEPLPLMDPDSLSEVGLTSQQKFLVWEAVLHMRFYRIDAHISSPFAYDTDDDRE